MPHATCHFYDGREGEGGRKREREVEREGGIKTRMGEEKGGINREGIKVRCTYTCMCTIVRQLCNDCSVHWYTKRGFSYILPRKMHIRGANGHIHLSNMYYMYIVNVQMHMYVSVYNIITFILLELFM